MPDLHQLTSDARGTGPDLHQLTSDARGTGPDLHQLPAQGELGLQLFPSRCVTDLQPNSNASGDGSDAELGYECNEPNCEMPVTGCKGTVVAAADQAQPRDFIQSRQMKHTGLVGACLYPKRHQHSGHFALTLTPCTICIGAGILQNLLVNVGVISFPHR